ncbi:MAG: hypothetical protein IPO24_20810 [Bacteroidetes bacterium]|nr:hypothetical protein [Bacteroidota bacterium]
MNAYGGAFTRFYPYAIEYGSKISDSISFQTAGLQILALRSIDTLGGIVGFVQIAIGIT